MVSIKPEENEDLTAQLRDPVTVRSAFSKVVRLYSEPLYWQIRRMVGSHDDANDILQNTFLKAWGSLENFRGEAKLSTWLYKIAVNESLSFLERENRRDAVSLDSDETPSYVRALYADDSVDGAALQQKLMRAIASLPEKQRIVFNMKYFDDMKYEQMSEILGTSVGALKASFHLATKKIEQYIGNCD